MRIAFMGTPEFSVPFLRALHRAGHEIAAVYTQPPRQRGRRGLSETPSPVHLAARALGLPVFTPQSLRPPAEQARFQALNLDAAIVASYGLLLPEAVLSAPRLGCYNAHGSLLPRWRGAAPVQRAIEAGDKETGIVIMRMDKGLDTGPVLRAARGAPFIRRLPIGADMTAGELFALMAREGAELMAQALLALQSGAFQLQEQASDGANYAGKIEKHETRIDWRKPASLLHRQIRAFSPAPGAWCEMRFAGADKPERVKILGAHLPQEAELAALPRGQMAVFAPAAPNSAPPAAEKAAALAVRCGGAEGDSPPLFLTKLQRQGGKTLAAAEFLRGRRIAAVL